MSDDYADLPDELKRELLCFRRRAVIDDQIMQIIADSGGEANIDTILVQLYRCFNYCGKRRYIQMKCYRMQQYGYIEAIKGRKGVYRLCQSMPPRPVERTDQ